MSIKTGKEKYIKNANILEDTARRLHLVVDYKIGVQCISLVISHKSKAAKLMILCTKDALVGEETFKRIGLHSRLIVNQTDMMRVALSEIRQFASNIIV